MLMAAICSLSAAMGRMVQCLECQPKTQCKQDQILALEYEAHRLSVQVTSTLSRGQGKNFPVAGNSDVVFN